MAGSIVPSFHRIAIDEEEGDLTQILQGLKWIGQYAKDRIVR